MHTSCREADSSILKRHYILSLLLDGKADGLFS
jgi:hypothetical protein